MTLALIVANPLFPVSAIVTVVFLALYAVAFPD